MYTHNLIRYSLFSLLALITLVACSNKETEEQAIEQEDKLVLTEVKETKKLKQAGEKGDYSQYSQSFQNFVNSIEFAKKTYKDNDYTEQERLIQWLGSILKTTPKNWSAELFGFHKPIFANDVYEKELLVLDEKSPYLSSLKRGHSIDPSSLHPETDGERYTGKVLLLNPWSPTFGIAKGEVKDFNELDTVLLTDDYSYLIRFFLYDQVNEKDSKRLPNEETAKESSIYAIEFTLENGKVVEVDIRE